MSLRDLRIARRLKRYGIIYPYRLVRAARKARVSVPTACALVSMETGNARNVYGHDPVTGPVKGGKVTQRNYAQYKRNRARFGMQGVGPVQLTWWEYQNQADNIGGCWHPYYNMLTGFRILRRHWEHNGHDLRDAYRQYNGSGAAAKHYARGAINQREVWKARLRGV